MSGDPAPPRFMPPTCCPFRESGAHWDAGHSQTTVSGLHGDALPIVTWAMVPGMSEDEALELAQRTLGVYEATAWINVFAPCEALRSRDPGAS